MKTLSEWQTSGQDIRDYLDNPCAIDKELYLYILECVPPAYLGELAQQGGDAEGSEEAEDGSIIFTYMTVSTSSKDSSYYYLGVLPEFKS